MNGVINSDVAIRVALTLAHSLWQGAAISVMAAVAASAFSRSAALRYQIYFAALVLCVVAAMVTFAHLSRGPDAPTGVVASSTPVRLASPLETDQPVSPLPLPRVVTNVGGANIPRSIHSTAKDIPAARWRFDWARCASSVVELYTFGVTLMLLRLSVAIRGGQRFRKAASPLRDDANLAALHLQADRLGLRFVPDVLQSARVVVPTVVGIFRPVILLPISVTTGLSADAIEAILAHELGHIRRYDHLLQLVQRLIEAIFFFHPAVWFLSKRIEIERENACDDLAVRVFPGPRDYADALLRAAELCRLGRGPAAIAGLTMARQPAGLRRRVARLLEPAGASQFRLPGVCTASILLILALVLALGLHHRANAAGASAAAAQPDHSDTAKTTRLESEGEKVIALPSNSAAVDKAVSPENLRAVASRTSDPEVLLGLVYLAPTGSPARPKISELAVKARPEFAPMVTILSIAMDGASEHSVGELIRSDPDNALGYYLEANRLYLAGKEKESLAMFQKAATCPELRLYGTVTANALFKALDALNLQGRDRLAASSWTAARMSNFYISDLQPLQFDLSEMSLKADLTTRRDISDLLVILGGHLSATNFENRQAAKWLLQVAFRLKARIAAAEKSPDKNGYFAVSQAILDNQLSWVYDEEADLSLQAARFLPSRVWGALAMANEPPQEATSPMGTKLKLSDRDMAAYKKAQEDVIKAGDALIEVSLTDPDGIIGAYLKDLPPPEKTGPDSGLANYSYVEKLTEKRQDVFKAATANEQAMRARDQAIRNDRNEQNVLQLMRVDEAVWAYTCDHNQTPPRSLEALYKDRKYLKDSSETKSLLTGKPYIYAAKGEKYPERQVDRESFIVVYDADEVDGSYQCAMGSGGGANLPANIFEECLRKQSK
jgi:beta-lactamase regulating signal transducer with metallopeptidase domain